MQHFRYIDDIVTRSQDADVLEIRNRFDHVAREFGLIRNNNLSIPGPHNGVLVGSAVVNPKRTQSLQPRPRQIPRIQSIAIENNYFHIFVYLHLYCLQYSNDLFLQDNKG